MTVSREKFVVVVIVAFGWAGLYGVNRIYPESTDAILMSALVVSLTMILSVAATKSL
jgi:hypothetical protein